MTEQTAPKIKVSKGSFKASQTAARLFAVQAVYQAMQNGQKPAELINEYLDHNTGMNLEGELEGEKADRMIAPDAALFAAILRGVSERNEDVAQLLKPRLKTLPEPLIRAILMAGTYELMAHAEIEAPIIISDYLNITHSFYEGAESKLVNAVLDAISKELRQS